jgi:hypothetical protein
MIVRLETNLIQFAVSNMEILIFGLRKFEKDNLSSIALSLLSRVIGKLNLETRKRPSQY